VCDAEADLVNALQEAGTLPDAIICDLNMPARTGIEVHKDLRALDSFADIPFILVSGLEPAKSLNVKAKEEGLKTIMLKPCTVADYNDFCIRLYNILLEKRA